MCDYGVLTDSEDIDRRRPPTRQSSVYVVE
jgi:hypothetical protein